MKKLVPHNELAHATLLELVQTASHDTRASTNLVMLLADKGNIQVFCRSIKMLVFALKKTDTGEK